MEKTPKIPHVVCIGDRAVFRRRVPKDIEKLADQYSRVFDREVVAARRQLVATQERTVRESDIPAIGLRYATGVLGTDEELRDEGFSDLEHRELTEMLSGLLAAPQIGAAPATSPSSDIYGW